MRAGRAKRVAACAALTTVGVFGAHPAAAQRCTSSRPFNDEESSFVRDQRSALLALVPQAPSGWVRRSVVDSATAAPLCDDAGYKPPLFVRVVATYLPADAPELSSEQRARESSSYEARLAAATREEAEAAKSNDRARLERARQTLRDLRAHPVPTPSAVPPRSARRLDFRLQVNPTSFQSCGRSAPIEFEGSAAAFRATGTTCRDRTPADVFLAAFGAWKTRPTPAGAFLAAFNEWPAPPVARTKVHTAFVEIAGDPDAVDAVLAVFDPARLRTLVGALVVP